jgi:polar amino acid transport system substrate-binding protein
MARSGVLAEGFSYPPNQTEKGESEMSKKNVLIAVLAASLMSVSASAQTVYKVGSTTTGSPFTYLDLPTNKIKGVMVDIIEEIAQLEGLKVEVQPVQFTALIPSLQGDKIDIMSAAVTITPVRATAIDFSDPLIPYSEGLVVPANDNTEYKSAKDFAGKIVGVQGGTTYYEYLKSVGGFSEIKTYDAIVDIMRDVELGRISAGFIDYPIAKYRLSQDKASKVRLVTSYVPGVVGQIALGVKKGNKELLDKLNAGAAKLKASGKLEQIRAKWSVN